jgi:hypothetical protein
MTDAAIDPLAIARQLIDVIFHGGKIDALISRDFLHYRNAGDISLDKQAATSDYTRLRASCSQLSVSLSRSLVTAQGIVCEPRIEGETISGTSFVLLPMFYVQIGADGVVYRVDEYIDSAALLPLVVAGYHLAP